MLPVIRLEDDVFDLDGQVKIVKAGEYRAYLSGEDIIARAEAKRKDIRNIAAEHYRREKRRGYRDGLAEAEAETHEKLLAAISKFNVFIAQAEESITELVINLVQKVIADCPDEDVTLGLVKNALRLMSQEKQVTIWVSAEQVNHTRENIDYILQDYANVDFIDVKADTRLAYGESRLETPIGVLDASIEQQIKLLKSHIAEKFRSLGR